MADSLLVGSINAESADAVFAAVGKTIGSEVRRVPDGETGDRLGWIFSLEPRFAEHEALERSDETWGSDLVAHAFPLHRPRPGMAAESIEFDNLGYADDALASWERLERAVQEGLLPADIRFQVSLPSAYVAVSAYITPEFCIALAPSYERAL